MVLPAREVADTVGPIVERILALDGLVDQVLVVDAASADGTAEVAAGRGRGGAPAGELLPELGPVLGKGDAMWRALAAVHGRAGGLHRRRHARLRPAFVTGLVGPLIAAEGVRFVKATYRRPFAAGGSELPDGGGRVSQLTARPLLSAFYPELAGLRPAAGRRGGRPARAARADPVRHRLRGGDGDAARRARRGRAPARSPRSTWASGATTTSRSTRCARWPTRCWRWSASACAARAGWRATAAPRAIVERPPFASLRAPPDGLRCVYTDLDGTLLGAGASLFRDGEGDFTLLPARALEACHRAGVEVVLKSGRRKAQVMEDARLIGQSSYIYEVGSGLVIDGEEHLLCGEFAPPDGPHAARADRGAGAPALLERELAAARAARAVARGPLRLAPLPRPGRRGGRRTTLLEREGHGGLRLVDNGEAAEGGHTYHLIPAAASKAAAVELHMRARGYAPRSASRSATRSRTWAWRRWWAASSWWRTRPRACGGPTWSAPSRASATGFYEAVVAELVAEA